MLKDKVAVVTGGTRGIGYAVVKKYLQNGRRSGCSVPVRRRWTRRSRP